MIEMPMVVMATPDVVSIVHVGHVRTVVLVIVHVVVMRSLMVRVKVRMMVHHACGKDKAGRVRKLFGERPNVQTAAFVLHAPENMNGALYTQPVQHGGGGIGTLFQA